MLQGANTDLFIPLTRTHYTLFPLQIKAVKSQ